MARFKYQALSSAFELVAGEIEADAVQHAIAALEAEGLVVQTIGFADFEPTPGQSAGARRLADTVPAPEQAEAVDAAAMQEHIGRALQRGQVLVPPLMAYAEEMPAGRERRELTAMCKLLDRGDAAVATAALNKAPDYWLPLVSAAAATGDPARFLGEFLEQSRQAGELRRQWRLTLAYPLALLGLAAAIIAVLGVTIVPAFKEIFDDFGLRLPAVTQATINAAEFMTSSTLLLGTALAAVTILISASARRLLPPRVVGWVGERFGGWYGRSTAIAQLARFTADLIEGGVNPSTALRITSQANPKPRIARAARRLAADLEAGRQATPPFYRRALTGTLVYALESEMPTPARVRLLRELGAAYSDRARQRLSWTHGIVGPIAIVFIGLAVGFVALSLFLPLVTLVNNLSG